MTVGAADPRTIHDPLYEPRWQGRRALVEVVEGAVTIREVELEGQARGDALRSAIAAACAADEVVLDGYLLPGSVDADALPPPPPTTEEITRRGLFSHLFVGSLGRHRDRVPGGEPEVALPGDGPIQYVAVDLLWLDGQPLVDLPLGERKRLLESVLSDGQLVRRTVAVRAPAERWHGQWRALGFDSMVVKAANSHYLPGSRSAEWAIAPIPKA